MKYVADTHSLTYASIKGDTLSIQQIAKDGREVDAFVITK